MTDRESRQDVADVLLRYATGIDRRDWALLGSCFTEDVAADYGAIGVWHGRDEIVEWMRATHEPLGQTLHRITNVVVEVTGEWATARSYVEALVLLAGDRSGTRATGYYDDDLVRTAVGWQISRRTFRTVAMQFLAEGDLVDLGPADPAT